MLLMAGPRPLLVGGEGCLMTAFGAGQGWPSPFASTPHPFITQGLGVLSPLPYTSFAGWSLCWYWGGGFGLSVLGADLLCAAEICGEIRGDLCPQQRLSKPPYFYGIPSCLQPASSSCYILSWWFIGAPGAGIAVFSCLGSWLLLTSLCHSQQENPWRAR